MVHTPHRLLFTGELDAGHHDRVIDALSARADAGARDILYIVASPAARRRAIRDLLGRRNAVFGLRVVTLRSLGAELFRRAHGTEPTRIDGVIDDLLVERTLRVAARHAFAESTPVHGLARKAASTIDLLERNDATPEQLASVVEREGASDGAKVLARTWAALRLARPRFGATDSAILSATRTLLESRPDVVSSLDLLVIEDLPLHTDVERRIVRALIAAARGDVIAAHGAVRRLPDAPSSRSLTWIRAAAAWEEHDIPSPSAGAPGRRGRGAAPIPNDGSTVRILEASGDVGEVRLAARVVRRHLDAGVPADQIALIVHANAARYRDLMAEVFEPAGIPVAMGVQRPVADTGIGSVLLRLLDLAIVPDRMTRETSLAVARAPHLDLRPRDRDRAHHHIITTGYLGLDGWDALALETLGEHAANRINRLKRAVAEARAAFGSVASPSQAESIVRRLARDLRLTGNAYHARRRLARAAGEELSSGTAAALAIREDSLAWEAIDEALGSTVPKMLDIDRASIGKPGTEYAAAWLAMFDRALRETPISAKRPPAHAVQLRSTGPGCEAPVRVAIVLGLIEKVFPRQARQDPFLDDELRSSLRERFGWHLPTSTDFVEHERECFVRATSAPTETLYLSYPATDAEGRPSVRSFFIDDLESELGAALPVERASTPTAIATIHDAMGRSQLLTAISHDIWQYLPRTADSAHRRAAAFRALEALATRGADLSTVRHGRRVTQRPRLDGALPPDAPHLTLTLSASQLKAIGHCTYEHFVQKVLSPVVLEPPEYDALEKGSLIHDAIMHWSTTLDGWTRGEAALPALHAWFEAQVAAWSPAKRGTERTARETESDLERLDDLLRAELENLRAPGVARPEYAELAFGEDMDEKSVRHPESRTDAFEMIVATAKGGTTVKFRGSMDRVDVISIGDKRYGVVIDYKTGRTSKYYAKEMLDGDDLQLRLYLLVLERFWGITPVGALYLGFGDGVRRGAVHAEFASRIAGVEPDAVKPLAPDEWDAFVGETAERITRLVDRLVRLDITPAPRDNKCGLCTLQPICRYDRWAPESTRV